MSKLTLTAVENEDLVESLERLDERLAALLPRLERIAEQHGVAPLPKPRPDLRVVEGDD
jgi:hypothetical protein